MSDKAQEKEAERQAALQNDTDTTPLDGMEETFSEEGAPQAPEATKKNGLPDDEPLRRALTDSDLIVSETSSRQWRRQWDTDEDGVEKKGTERWVEVEYRGATEVPVEDVEES